IYVRSCAVKHATGVCTAANREPRSPANLLSRARWAPGARQGSRSQGLGLAEAAHVAGAPAAGAGAREPGEEREVRLALKPVPDSAPRPPGAGGTVVTAAGIP